MFGISAENISRCFYIQRWVLRVSDFLLPSLQVMADIRRKNIQTYHLPKQQHKSIEIKSVIFLEFSAWFFFWRTCRVAAGSSNLSKPSLQISKKIIRGKLPSNEDPIHLAPCEEIPFERWPPTALPPTRLPTWWKIRWQGATQTCQIKMKHIFKHVVHWIYNNVKQPLDFCFEIRLASWSFEWNPSWIPYET